MITLWVIIALLCWWTPGFLGYHLIKHRFITKFHMLGSKAWDKHDFIFNTIFAWSLGPIYLLATLLFLWYCPSKL